MHQRLEIAQQLIDQAAERPLLGNRQQQQLPVRQISQFTARRIADRTHVKENTTTTARALCCGTMETPAAPAAAAPAATTAQTTGGQAAEPGQAADETPCKWCGKITAVLFAGIIAAGVVVIANMVTGGKVAEAWRRATAPEPDPGADEE